MAIDVLAKVGRMLKIGSAFAAALRSVLKARRDLALENLALRH